MFEYAPIDDICYKGFEFKDNKSYVFPTGFINLLESNEARDNKNNKQYTVIMFKIAVGRS